MFTHFISAKTLLCCTLTLLLVLQLQMMVTGKRTVYAAALHCPHCSYEGGLSAPLLSLTLSLMSVTVKLRVIGSNPKWKYFCLVFFFFNNYRAGNLMLYPLRQWWCFIKSAQTMNYSWIHTVVSRPSSLMYRLLLITAVIIMLIILSSSDTSFIVWEFLLSKFSASCILQNIILPSHFYHLSILSSWCVKYSIIHAFIYYFWIFQRF